jgi:O-antigen/teichoic acid export membrane protein
MGNLACSSILGHHLAPYPGEFGYCNTLLDFVGFLGLPLQMLSMSLIHYIAHFRSRNDQARLQGLLAGCQKLLLWATAGGSVLAIVLAEPLGRYFDFPRSTMMVAALICGLVGWWSGFGVALCQGMSWFKRMAVISVAAVGVRMLFAWTMTKRFHTAEIALSSTTISLLVNFTLFYWWKDLFRHGTQKISPWNRQFVDFLVVTGATVAGTYFFNFGDSLVSNKYFPHAALDAYQAAARFGRAIPATVGPLLIVMFTSRSGSKEGAAASDQRILLTLYAAGLSCGALGLILFRGLLVKLILGRYDAEAAAMIIPFSITMAITGLNQAIGMWNLADRRFKMALLYGALGLAYWLTLLLVGRTPAALLRAMPIGAGAGFCVLCAGWLAGRSRRAAT